MVIPDTRTLCQDKDIPSTVHGYAVRRLLVPSDVRMFPLILFMRSWGDCINARI